jgi:hypothetical protein
MIAGALLNPNNRTIMAGVCCGEAPVEGSCNEQDYAKNILPHY